MDANKDQPTQGFNRRQALAWAAAATASAASAWPPLAGAQAASAAFAAAPSPGFDAWAETFAADWVRLSPEGVTYSQYFSGAEQTAFDHQLGPNTVAWSGQYLALARSGLSQIASHRRQGLTPQQLVNAGILAWSLEREVAYAPYREHDFVFSQMGGPQVGYVSFMSEAHPLRRLEDVDAYVSRLALIGTRMDEALARAQAAAARGLLPPRFILDRARTQVGDFLAQPAAENLFVQALRRRSESITGLTPEVRQAALASAVQLVEERIRPAWQRVATFLDGIRPRTTADAGLWRLPDGGKAYAEKLAYFTTTQMTANEVHALGLREVARIESEMDLVLRRLGHKDGSVKARVEQVKRSVQPPPEPDPRPGLVDRHMAYVADNIRRAQALFNIQPKAAIEVRREPPLTEKTAAAHYSSPAPDGSRPGLFWVPLPGPVFDIPAMRSLAVHEAVPGHHFQLAIQQEQTGLPRWRQRLVFGGGSAHAEGWALYAERLAIDNGWYEGDDVSLLGALDSQLFRARRLVVDTGLHARRWTREQAIDYGISAQEVERYVVMPGQACAYMIDMLRLIELRDGAKRQLGARFDTKAFHDLVLTSGSMPLDVLGDVVTRWVAAQSA